MSVECLGRAVCRAHSGCKGRFRTTRLEPLPVSCVGNRVAGVSAGRGARRPHAIERHLESLENAGWFECVVSLGDPKPALWRLDWYRGGSPPSSVHAARRRRDAARSVRSANDSAARCSVIDFARWRLHASCDLAHADADDGGVHRCLSHRGIHGADSRRRTLAHRAELHMRLHDECRGNNATARHSGKTRPPARCERAD